jgi:hypothetical protein
MAKKTKRAKDIARRRMNATRRPKCPVCGTRFPAISAVATACSIECQSRVAARMAVTAAKTTWAAEDADAD